MQPEEVIVAPGSKFLVASQLFFSKKVAIISPHWPTYVQMAKKFGKKIQIIKTTLEDKWLPNFDEIEKDVDTIIINYPNNPTGIAILETKMKELLDIASELNVKIVSEEVYRDITFNKKYVSILGFNYEKGIFIYSFSKTFSMTGFRIGYAIADKKEIGEIQKFIEIMVTCVPKFVQSAAIKALEVREEIKRKIVNIYRKRVELVKKKLNRKLFEFVEPDGAFYVFPKLKNNISGRTFAYKLLGRGVGIFPGEAFGNYSSHIRISLTSSMFEFPETVKVCSIHPLLGNRSKDFKSRKIVIIPIKGREKDCDPVKSLFESLGAEIVVSDPKTHDRAIGITISLPYFIGVVFSYLISQENLNFLNKYAGTSFEHFLTYSIMIAEEKPEFIISLLNNEYSYAAIRKFLQLTGKLIKSINEVSEFERFFKKIAKHLKV